MVGAAGMPSRRGSAVSWMISAGCPPDRGPLWIDVQGDAPGVIAGPDQRRFGLVEPTLARPPLSGVPCADFG
jgi:hypothetical protein